MWLQCLLNLWRPLDWPYHWRRPQKRVGWESSKHGLVSGSMLLWVGLEISAIFQWPNLQNRFRWMVAKTLDIIAVEQVYGWNKLWSLRKVCTCLGMDSVVRWGWTSIYWKFLWLICIVILTSSLTKKKLMIPDDPWWSDDDPMEFTAGFNPLWEWLSILLACLGHMVDLETRY